MQAGSAFANDKYEINSLTASRSNETRWGWMVGAGIEYSFSDNWSAKIEYYYLDFGTRTLKKRENFIWTSGTTFSVSTIIGSDMGYPADIGCVGLLRSKNQWRITSA